MSDERRFLRPDVIIEPLVDRFYAWTHVPSSAQAAMNLAFVQVPLLESCPRFPQVHINASDHPEPRGGFFVNVQAAGAGETRGLLTSIKRDRAQMPQGAAGFNLTPLHPMLPAAPTSLVEIAYDANNQASMRLSPETGVERPFIPSTLRLSSPDVPALRVPFRHQGSEELVRSRVHGTTLSGLREMPQPDDDQDTGLSRFLATKPDPAGDPHIVNGGRIRYLGHACLMMQTPEPAVVTDPWISSDAAATDRFSRRDLPDHIELAGPRGGLADPSLALSLSHLGPPVTEAIDFSEVEFPGGKVTATPFLGEHAGLDIRAKSTHMVRMAGQTMFAGADSPGIEPGLYLDNYLGHVDMAFPGMECTGAPPAWPYQALFTKYAMGEETWLVGQVMATTVQIRSPMRPA